MITLNIIPQNLKKEIKLLYISKSLHKIMFFLLTMAIIYSGILLTSKIILSNIYKSTSLLVNTITKDTEEYSSRVNTINDEVNYIDLIQNKTIYWLPIIKKFSYLTGPDIKLNKLSLDKEKNLLSVSGTAPSPESLLNFKDNLEKSNFLENINLPLKLLFTKGEVNFNINATISTYEFD